MDLLEQLITFRMAVKLFLRRIEVFADGKIIQIENFLNLNHGDFQEILILDVLNKIKDKKIVSHHF